MSAIERESFIEELRSHFNEPVLMSDKLARLVGFAEDEHDYYLVVVYMGGKRQWHTAVGGYVFLDRLKGQGYVKAHNGEDWDDLSRLSSVLALNGAPLAEAFEVLIAPAPTESGGR